MKNILFFIVISINICIFALSLKTINHETQNKGVAKKEKELSYYLQLYNEIQTRDNVSQILACLDVEIDELVETLKRMK